LPAGSRGSGFGLRLALFTVGSVVGPIIAGAIMLLSSGNFRLAFWLAVIPAFLSVAVLGVTVREQINGNGSVKPRLSLNALRQFPPLFWWVISVTAVLELGRFSQAFLLLKAHEVGVAAPYVPGFLVLMSAVYGMSAYPCGILADRMNRRMQWFLGVAVLGICHVVLATADTASSTAIGAVFWGLQMGMLQGLLAVSVAEAAPAHLRGTAFGIYYFVDGVASLLASSLAGILWASGGSGLTFLAGALLACAVGGMLLVKPLPR
jgi:MFS family permease